MIATDARVHSNTSCHWYHGDGRRCFEVPYADPAKGFRPTTLRDARKLGLVPSVTTVLNVLDKPGLNAWKAEMTALAVLTAPRLDGEPLDAFVKRVLQTDRDQDSESTKARELGTAIHAAIELALSDEFYAEHLKAYVEPVVALVKSFGVVRETEKVVVGDGYAGTMDMLTEGQAFTVWDFKTCKALPDKSYPEHRLQLSAYGQALGNTGDKQIITVNLYISTTEPGRIEVFEHINWGETYNQGFKPLFQVWRWLNQFYL